MFWFVEDIPKQTSKVNPIVKTWELDYGFINLLLIIIPAGASGLTGIRILKGTSQIEPRNTGEYIIGNNLELRIPMAIEMYDRPFNLTAVMYNEDDTYDHKIITGIGFIKGKPSKPVTTFAELMRYKI